MLTANTYERHRQAALDAGVDAFLAKPITSEALYAAISQLAGASGGPACDHSQLGAPIASNQPPVPT